CSTWGYGSSGTFGFRVARVRDRFHGGAYAKFRHSDYFNRKFVRQYWIPYILYGVVVPNPDEAERPPSSWWMNALSLLPLKWVLFVAIPLVVLIKGMCTLDQQGIVNFPSVLGNVVCNYETGFSGTVTEANGVRKPLANVEIIIENLNAPKQGQNASVFVETTDERGRFHFRDLPVKKGEPLEIVARKLGFEESRERVAAGLSNHQISMTSVK
ncbi:MAG: carboxypeptidase regulatory-like domain-containing protein, partial [Verrucomicrobiae bacterium]|nr:carboxypeptidase regulatory-like domain-containing protein [Verrucomicrobiae bacterium]